MLLKDALEVILPFIGILLAFHGGRLYSKAQARNLDVDTITKLSEQVNDLVTNAGKLREDLDKYRNQIEEKDNQLTEKEETIEALSKELREFKSDVRSYLARLMKYLEEKGLTDYPQPSDNLLETHPRMKAARK